MVWMVPRRFERKLEEALLNEVASPTQGPISPPPLAPQGWTAVEGGAGAGATRMYRVRLTRVQYVVERYSFQEEAFVEVAADDVPQALEVAQEAMDRGDVDDWEDMDLDRNYGDTEYVDTDHYEVDTDSVEEIERRG